MWGPEELSAFESLRAALCSHPVLVLPDLRAHRTFTIETDASDVAIGAVLQQDNGGGPQPVAYLSHKLSSAKSNYPTHEKELLAIIVACKKWRPYLDGCEMVIVTDHRTL